MIAYRRTVSVGGFSKCDDARLARTQMLHNALDHTVLAGGVATFQDDQDLIIALDEMALQLDQFDLQLVQTILVRFLRDRGRVPARIIFVAFVAHDRALPSE
jgi:hypothetical protein